MPTELYWMLLCVTMTALFWLPYIVDRLVVRGVWVALSDRGPELGGHHSLWAQRAMRAHANAVENLVLLVPAVLALVVLDISTPATRAAVPVYFFARLAHFAVYTLGLPLVRTLAFAVGWTAQLVLLAALLCGA